LQDLMAGQIDVVFDVARSSLPLVRSGSIKAYAVTSDTRLSIASEYRPGRQPATGLEGDEERRLPRDAAGPEVGVEIRGRSRRASDQ
jgi:hypothetical protein